jgi:serine O-acetyltransferase
VFENFKADIGRYRRYGFKQSTLRLFFENQGLWAMLCYRIGRHLHEHRLPPILRQIVGGLYRIYWQSIQVTTGIYIPPTVKIGPGFFVAHFGQIFLGGDSVIGRDCVISQGVSVGYAYKDGVWGIPSLGDRVFIAAGAKVIGPIFLANGTVVGANAVVKSDTEENAVMVGVPARAVSYSGSDRYIS